MNKFIKNETISQAISRKEKSKRINNKNINGEICGDCCHICNGVIDNKKSNDIDTLNINNSESKLIVDILSNIEERLNDLEIKNKK
jgi:hypothetical protein